MARKDDQALLDEIKTNFDYARAYWEPVYAEGDTDVRYATDGPWDDVDYLVRGDRPTLVLDELAQYANQLKNQVRQNKRSVKVKPEGDGANDDTALMRAGIIRGIEYKSKAQQAYSGAFGDAVDRSFGYAKLVTEFEVGTFNRCMKVVRVANPRVIYLDPDFKEADASDAKYSFEIERMHEKAFLKRWPKAEVRSFTPDHIAEAPLWLSTGDNGKYVQVASYCRLEQGTKKLVLLEDGSTLDLATVEGAKLVKLKSIDGKPVDGVALPDGRTLRAVDVRDDNDPKVVQYMTNGIEILDRTELDFTEVPIIPCFGPETWITRGGSSKREFGSLIRKARGPFKAYCYACSGAVERLGQDPKTPYEGWEGQFNTNTDFSKLATNQQGYVEFAPGIGPNGEVLATIPSKNFAEPAIQQYMLAAEQFRRAIQAAMGGSPLPTAAQRKNEKSGIALKQIEESADQGNFHFIDNYDRFLERIGRMMDAALDTVYSPNGFAGRDVPFQGEDDEHSVKRINKFQMDAKGQPIQGPDGQPAKEGFHLGESGTHGVTISTGPSSQSQRDAADDFSDSLLQHPELLGPTPNKVVALIVKLRNIGPIGDRIADIIAPPDQGPAIPPQIQQHMQEADQMVQKLTQEVDLLKAGLEIKKYTVDEQEKTKRVLGLATIQSDEARTALEQELGIIHKVADRGSEVIQNSQDRAHEAGMAADGRQHEAAMSQQDQEHQDSASEAQRQHEANLSAQQLAAQAETAKTKMAGVQ